MQMKMRFMVLEIWLFGFGKVLEVFLEEFVRTLAGRWRRWFLGLGNHEKGIGRTLYLLLSIAFFEKQLLGGQIPRKGTC